MDNLQKINLGIGHLITVNINSRTLQSFQFGAARVLESTLVTGVTQSLCKDGASKGRKNYKCNRL